ncbi:TetR/AcrR family transcriptional regulator [Glaciecola petra]|uniref:TetR/AcrR family transcriptional regulator n=1 Tax=Glaciecola petra TaxID=3075602 RepID=A0ABU2ZUZ5_9ALTE|nr:TetR/AcrR family transcriptional regulator [Aestuariibacter sp. P117]MDT0596425.1 TetR/AcrR family transcriptional regulator [Aestuariibacter sp. P117]
MARKPEYSINEVFKKALIIISDKGYKACSMQHLIEKTQFNRRAFYQQFKHKQDFIEQLLSYYIEHSLLPLQASLNYTPNKNDSDKLTHLITDFFNRYQHLIDQDGCLLVKLSLELGKQNVAVQNMARRYYDNLHLSFIACLERAHARGEIPHISNIESMALKLTCFTQAFAVSNNLQQGQSDVHIVIQSLFEPSSEFA